MAAVVLHALARLKIPHARLTNARKLRSTMNEDHPIQTYEKSPSRGWGHRIIIASLAGIFFLTLYPFEFSAHTILAPGRSPFLLGTANKGGGTLDVILNIFLFLPFGFGLAARLRGKAVTWLSALFYTWVAGALLSYFIEFLQIYISARDSGWEDVFSNSTGAALGCLIFGMVGGTVLRGLANAERVIEAWLPPRRAVLIISVLFICWLFYSTYLQKKSHFETWNQDSFLVFGNDATGRRPWRGKLFRIEIWNRGLSSASAQSLTGGDALHSGIDSPLASFDFASLPPRQDNAALLIPLSSAMMRDPQHEEDSFGGLPLIASSRPVSDLIADLQHTNQFSVRVVFTPDDISDAHGRIVSISALSGIPDMFVGQSDEDLFFWFRNELSVKRPGLAWDISKLLAPGRPRDLLFSFDGSDLRLYADGRKLQDRYWGPGTALASLIRHVKQGELNGYRYIFYAVIFVPIGWLVAMAARRTVCPQWKLLVAIAAAFLTMPVILEWKLALFDQRALSLRNLFLSVGMALAGFLWANSDRVTAPQTTFDQER